MKDGFYESREEFENDFTTFRYKEREESPRLYLINTDIGRFFIKEEKNGNGVTFGFKIYCNQSNLNIGSILKEIECKYSKKELREKVQDALGIDIQSILKGIMNKLNFNVVKEKEIGFGFLCALYNSLSDREIYNEILEPGKEKNICDIINKYQKKMELGSKDFCVVFLCASEHALTLIIPKDMGQKTIIINSMSYKTNENFLKEKLQGLSHEDLNKFNLGTLYFIKGIEKKVVLGSIPNLLERLNIPMFEELFNQLNNISYIQYTVQENGSCCVFGSTFAELCAGKKNYKEVCKYLGIGQKDTPILTDAYNSIKTGFPDAVSTIFCQDPNKIERLTFKNYIPNPYEYLGYIYDDIREAINENGYNGFRCCQEADKMIEIQKAESYYDWNNYEGYKKYITIVKEGSPLYDYIKNYTQSLEDALKDMPQEQGSTIARQQ